LGADVFVARNLGSQRVVGVYIDVVVTVFLEFLASSHRQKLRYYQLLAVEIRGHFLNFKFSKQLKKRFHSHYNKNQPRYENWTTRV